MVRVLVTVLTPPLSVSPLSVNVTVTVELPLLLAAIVKLRSAVAGGMFGARYAAVFRADVGTTENSEGFVKVMLDTVNRCPALVSNVLPTLMPVKNELLLNDWVEPDCTNAIDG